MALAHRVIAKSFDQAMEFIAKDRLRLITLDDGDPSYDPDCTCGSLFNAECPSHGKYVEDEDRFDPSIAGWLLVEPD